MLFKYFRANSVWRNVINSNSLLEVLCTSDVLLPIIRELKRSSAQYTMISHGELFWIRSDDKQKLCTAVMKTADRESRLNPTFALPHDLRFLLRDILDGPDPFNIERHGMRTNGLRNDRPRH